MSDPSHVHATLAANRLDPNIEADGHLNAGQGVGGTSEKTIHKEGVEHVKQQNLDSSDSPSQSQSQAPTESQSAVHQDGIDYIKSQTFGAEPAASHATTSNAFGTEPPASNPGVDDKTAGIGQEAGGVSNTAHIESPVPVSGAGGNEAAVGEPQSVIGSTVEGIKSYLGFGSTTTAAAAATDETPGYGTSGGVTRADTDGPVSEYNPTTSSLTSATTTTAPSTSTTNPTTSSSSTFDTMADSQAEQRIADKTVDDVPTQESKGIASHERGLEDAETTTGADKQTEDTTDAGQAGAGAGDVGETNKPPAAAGGRSGAIENKSAIPTAGGERLGEKHWGESKIVPDVPKLQGDSAGVASKDGQPTDEVKDNTAANTGSATGGPHSHAESGEKEGLVDKIKDKLHLGKK